MRTISLNGMLTSLAFNYNHRNKNVRLYELGNIYLPGELPVAELPDERMQFTLGMYGEGDFFVMKGVVEEFFEKAGLHKRRLMIQRRASHSCIRADRPTSSTMGRYWVIWVNFIRKWRITTVLAKKAYVAVLDMPKVVQAASFDRKFEGIARFPAVTRDLSMVVPREILAGQIEAMIVQRGGKTLESCSLFDIYEGEQIKEGFKSMAYSVVFRAKDKTLEEAEITASMKKILNGLESMGIELRQ